MDKNILRGAFGAQPGTPSEQTAVSTLECDVLQQVSDILQSELQTPGVQQAQDLLQHVIDNTDSGDGGDMQQWPMGAEK